MSKKSRELWRKANEYLSASIEELKVRSREEILRLIENDSSEELEINGVKLSHWVWAKKEEDGSIGVIAEIRRNRILGWSQVRASGFFHHPDGHIVVMRDEDLWDHGY